MAKCVVLLVFAFVVAIHVLMMSYALRRFTHDSKGNIPSSTEANSNVDFFGELQPLEKWDNLLQVREFDQKESIRFFDTVNTLEGEFPTDHMLWRLILSIYAHYPWDADIMAVACEGTARLVINPKNEQALLAHTTFIPLLKAILDRHHDQTKIQGAGILLVRTLTHHLYPEQVRQFGEFGFLDYLQSVGIHTKQPGTVVASCLSLQQLAVDKENRFVMETNELIEALQAVIPRWATAGDKEVPKYCGQFLEMLTREET